MEAQKIVEEVTRFLKDCDDGKDVVLIRENDKDKLGYSIIRKSSFSFMIIEDTRLAKEFIKVLLSKNVEVFDDIMEAKEKFNLKRKKPLFWPKDKPWPSG